MLRFNAGDRAGALAYYRRFCQRLGSEFGVEPMPDGEMLRIDIQRILPGEMLRIDI